MISKILLSSALVAVADAGKCPYGYGSADTTEEVQLDTSSLITVKSRVETAKYPSDILTCPTGKTEVLTTANFSKADYESVVKQIVAVMEALPEQKDRTAFAGCLVRLEGHDLMDFRRAQKKNRRGRVRPGQAKVSGGSDGCVNFTEGDNKGLPQCLAKAGIEDIYGKWCDKVSLADFIVIAAEAVTGGLAADYDKTNMFKSGTLASKFRDQLQVGRTTQKECASNVGMMPNPENGCDDLNKIFVDHIFSVQGCGWRCGWGLTAAISGAHSIGSAKLHNSGYEGSWSDPKNSATFNNNYYHALLDHGWGPNRAINGNPDKNNWKRVDVQMNKEPFEMMLNTDMCLAYQYNKKHIDCLKAGGSRRSCKKFRKKGVFLNAKTNDCCAWTARRISSKFFKNWDKQFCGIPGDRARGDERKECCIQESKESEGDCDAMEWPKGPAFNEILKLGKDNNSFYAYYLKAWKIGTENGWKLKPLS